MLPSSLAMTCELQAYIEPFKILPALPLDGQADYATTATRLSLGGLRSSGPLASFIPSCMVAAVASKALPVPTNRVARSDRNIHHRAS
jgi:hypothetical protein